MLKIINLKLIKFKVNSEVKCTKPLTILYSCVFCEQEKKAPDSGVQVAGLSLETATRPFPLASSASWLALREKDKHREQLEAQTITKNKTPHLGSCRHTMFKHFWGGLVRYSIKCCPCCPLRLSGESMKTRPWPSETAAAQISRERTIHISHLFLGPVDQKSRTEQRECGYIVALSFNMRGLPAPLPCGLKRFEEGFHICNAHREQARSCCSSIIH